MNMPLSVTPIKDATFPKWLVTHDKLRPGMRNRASRRQKLRPHGCWVILKQLYR